MNVALRASGQNVVCRGDSMANMVMNKGIGAVSDKRSVSIKQLLEWVFQREKANLDFSDAGMLGGQPLPSVGVEYLMIEQAKLGCRVDGGGKSEPHPDADLVTDALVMLPEGVGGRGMAMMIVELAKTGRAPDWMPGAKPRLVPVDTYYNQHGTFAKTVDAKNVALSAWKTSKRRNKNGVMVEEVSKCCPVVARPSADLIARCRREYLQWVLALLELRTTFQYRGLSAFEVTDELPDAQPWKKTLDQV
jgi:hypothetical protein